MKVFICREGEGIVIGEDLVIHVTEVGEDEVCLKIQGSSEEHVSLGEDLHPVNK